MITLTHLFISKHRKVHFDIAVVIQDLVNIPLVSGLFFVNWRIKNASHAHGATQRIPINDHTVYWNQPIKVLSEMVISKQRLLGPCELKLQVFQELGGKQTSCIGDLTINLSEYANDNSNNFITERFLLDNSKFNSTLKLTIGLHQKSDLDIEYEIPVTKKKQLSSTISSLIIERKAHIPSAPDEITLDRATGEKINRLAHETLAATSLKPCRQVIVSQDPQYPSPHDVVEQLFAH